MSWLEQYIRNYEHRHWSRDQRAVQPFAWGLEHVGGRAEEADPKGWLSDFAKRTIADSDNWFGGEPARDYRLVGDQLTFTSTIRSPWAENNRVHARYFPARAGQAMSGGPAVLVMAQWNAKPHEHVGICEWLNTLGISALRMTMPYHDSRATPGHDRAYNLVSPNIGLTLQANRQAVQDARRCLRWFEQQGFTRLGILGTSIGSSVGYITLVHDSALRAGGFFHVSTYFADVVSQGMTTNHVWESLRHHVTVDELRDYWAPVSPMPYVERGMGAGKNAFMVYGKYDPTFIPELTHQMLAALRRHDANLRTLELHCGHYSLELPPFSHIAGYRMLTFLRSALA
jgi:Prolyl oligopeptidase family